ncbi:hypothetical protein BTW00_03685 [Psychrobacter sp. C 20.9]|uniref:hypothetical protein n=1 Tax=Psychrobacter sp. C 20.9 TaxID=1926477 RepID=UPI000946D457|nr:hypothetical protein [Psychrobacter sp. C 20.9]OLF37210.1 hypothetical protein BTW00_03685 [Psychrobacter sp. C 20.9]
MKALTGFFIRKNKNVQVRCLGPGHCRNDPERLTIKFLNGHTKYMSQKQFFNEFINLDDLLAEITEGSQWESIGSRHTIRVTDIKVRTGRVLFRIDGVPKEYSFSSTDIFRFKDLFLPVREAK